MNYIDFNQQESPVTTALIQNITGFQPQPISSLEVKCEVCNLSVSSYVRNFLKFLLTFISFYEFLCFRSSWRIIELAGELNYRRISDQMFSKFPTHFRKHKNELQKLIRMKKINKNCEVCKYIAMDFIDWERHITSETHVEKVKLFMPIPTDKPKLPPEPVQPVPVPISAPVAASSSSMQQKVPPPLIPPKESEELNRQLNMKALTSILSKNKKEWRCANCQIICQSLCSWNAHLTSKKHRKNKHKFHLYPGISKEVVKKKYYKSFVRPNEAIGNEFIEEGVVFFCKRCNVRMQTKQQLDIHMNSNMHKMNFPINAMSQQYEEFMNQSQIGDSSIANPYYESPNLSTYGYAGRNWVKEPQFLLQSQAEKQHQLELERERQLVEQAKSDLLRRFPFYALNMQNQQAAEASTQNISPEDIPMPVEPPSQDTQTSLLYDPTNPVTE